MSGYTSALRWFSISILCAVLVSGCSAQEILLLEQTTLDTEESSLALVGFSQALQTRDLLAGFIPPGSARVTDKEIQTLDSILAREFEKSGVYPGKSIPAHQTQFCIDALSSGKESDPAMQYWLAVGECVQVQYLLVPQVLYWSEAAADKKSVPVTIIFDIAVLDVRLQQMVGRFHFDTRHSTQAQNPVEADKTAIELATTGIRQAVQEFGL